MSILYIKITNNYFIFTWNGLSNLGWMKTMACFNLFRRTIIIEIICCIFKILENEELNNAFIFICNFWDTAVYKKGLLFKTKQHPEGADQPESD